MDDCVIVDWVCDVDCLGVVVVVEVVVVDVIGVNFIWDDVKLREEWYWITWWKKLFF